MINRCLLVLVFIPLVCFGQKVTEKEVDLKYREDQFYLGVVYNYLIDNPKGVDQHSFSYGLNAGFIRDFPINKRRNLAVGLGVGYSLNELYSNILAFKNNEDINYRIIPFDLAYKRNKISTHQIDFPLELRWRSSTASDYSFWRIYAGIKLSYVFSSRSKLVGNSETIVFSNNDIEKFQYGASLHFGFASFNIQLYYPLNPLLTQGTSLESGSAINSKAIRIGFIFYIL